MFSLRMIARIFARGLRRRVAGRPVGGLRSRNPLIVEELEDRTLCAVGGAAALAAAAVAGAGSAGTNGRPVPAVLGQASPGLLNGAGAAAMAARMATPPRAAAAGNETAPAGNETAPAAAAPVLAAPVPTYLGAPPPARPGSAPDQPGTPRPSDPNGDRGLAPAPTQRFNPDLVPGNGTDRPTRNDTPPMAMPVDLEQAERGGNSMFDQTILGYNPFAADWWGKGDVADWLQGTDGSPLLQGAPPSPGLPTGLELLDSNGARDNRERIDPGESSPQVISSTSGPARQTMVSVVEVLAATSAGDPVGKAVAQVLAEPTLNPGDNVAENRHMVERNTSPNESGQAPNAEPEPVGGSDGGGGE